MGWLVILALIGLLLLALWRFAGLGRSELLLAGIAALVALAGYTWQGRPGLAGNPLAAADAGASLPDTAFAQTRQRMLGTFDTASSWLNMADAYERLGDTYGAAEIVRAGIRAHPNNADLWVGLGNALVVHSDGLMTPAAELAFQHAARLAPDHPAPKFFYGLALVQGGRFDEAERIWLDILVHAPPNASWRPMIEERLEMLTRLRAATMPAAAGGAQAGAGADPTPR